MQIIKRVLAVVIFLAFFFGVRAVLRQPAQHRSTESKPQASMSPSQQLSDARQGFQTHLTRQMREHDVPPEPPQGMFNLVRYPSPAGSLAAYISPDPGDGQKHPAIIWVVGGFDSSISEVAWQPAPQSNDQSASAFRKAGIMMMYPSLRGGNQNPGFKEGFYGEVDDVLAAADFLAAQPGVDPTRIYLGGHSTGGTLVLLAAECSNRFRTVFAFGPVADVKSYGPTNMPFDINDSDETRLRSPGYWLPSIKSPVIVFEGTGRGNAESLRWMMEHCQNSNVQFHLVERATHFTILAPVTKMIADQIVNDTGPTPHFAFDDGQMSSHFR